MNWRGGHVVRIVVCEDCIVRAVADESLSEQASRSGGE